MRFQGASASIVEVLVQVLMLVVETIAAGGGYFAMRGA
jgi:hypothetical protein